CLFAFISVELLLSGKLSEYDVIVPFSVDHQGRFLSHVVSDSPAPAQHSTRHRMVRSIPTKEAISGNPLYFFNVTAWGKELHLRLKPNQRLVSPGALAEWQEDFQEVFREPLKQECVFTGGITGMPEARVAISNCDGLAGIIRTDNGEFFIEPLERGQWEKEEDGRAHVVYRRWSSFIHSLCGHLFLTLLIPDFILGQLPQALNLIENQIGEAERKRRHAKKDDYNIEVLLAVDDTVVRFHGKEHVQNYVLTLMNIVNEIYHDESLGVHINIVLVRMIMVGYRQSVTLIERGNPSRSLEQVCRWAHSQQRSDPAHTEYHDHAIFLTRQDFGPAGMQGTVFTSIRYVQFGGYHRKVPPKQDILCSSYDCLLDDPFMQDWPRLPELPGIDYTMDEQCRFDFGVGYKTCTAWCFKGHCIWKTSEQPYSQDGGWSSWSKFGSCSRTCGGGVRSRSRNCNRPPPAYGGRQCPGAMYEYQVCNAEECQGPYEDFRAQQCSKRNSYYTHENSKHTWLPYEHPEDAQKCELICQSEKTGDVVFMNQVVHDGTRCTYRDPYSICVRGECVHVGCDREIGSLKEDDKCGVCGGDNSHCRTVKATLVKTPKQSGGALKMFEIPVGARHIQIEEMEPASHTIAVKNQASGDFIINPSIKIVKNHTFLKVGLEWEYTTENGKKSLRTSGPLHEAINVLVIPQDDSSKSSLMYKYIIHEDLLPVIGNNNVLLEEMDIYEWALKGWSPCSKACGGGIMLSVLRTTFHMQACPGMAQLRWARVVHCIQQLQNGTNRTMHSKYCAGEKPDTRRPCSRIPCPAQWRTGAWSQCSVSCGEGIQQRQVICKSKDNSIGQCDNEKPEAFQVCQLEECPGRPPNVTANANTSNHVTPQVQWVSEETVKHPVSKVSSKVSCLGDKSVFCQMEVLARYCSIPGYHKLCCESCSRKVATTQPPGVDRTAPETEVQEGAVHPSLLPPLTFYPTAVSHLQRIKATTPKETQAVHPLPTSLTAHSLCRATAPWQCPGNTTARVRRSGRLSSLRQLTAGWIPENLQINSTFQWFPLMLDKNLAASQGDSKSSHVSSGVAEWGRDNGVKCLLSNSDNISDSSTSSIAALG
ncbi:A disintegrin and metalloproteinase with thrombospondin motifs 14, partial [Ophiophagus hannah]